MNGIVTASREAIVPLLVSGPAAVPESVDAVIDTGYDGVLCLPRSIIMRLGLTWRDRNQVRLGDGSTSSFDVYEALIFWDGRAMRIEVDAVETTPLIGMALLNGFRLTIDIVPNGLVLIEPVE